VPIREGIETFCVDPGIFQYSSPKRVPIREGIETPQWIFEEGIDLCPKRVPIREGIETFLALAHKYRRLVRRECPSERVLRLYFLFWWIQLI